MPEKSEKRPAPHYAGHRARLRQRFLKGDMEAMADYELIELLLFLALPRRDVKPLAKELLQRFGSFGAAISADPAELALVPGLGETAAVAFKTVQAAAVRLVRGEVIEKPVLGSWKAVTDYCRAAMGHEKVERFRILYLNRRNVLIADEVQQRGTVDHTPVYPREVVKRALELGATAIIMVHNHPSGDATPSRADVEMTREVREAGEKLGIMLHDHIIVSRSEYRSFKALGLL